MSKFLLWLMLCLLPSLTGASPKTSFYRYSSMDFGQREPRSIIPFPLKLTAQTLEGEARRLFHFLKRAFIGLSAHYSKGQAYSNLGPVVGIQLPTPFGLRFWAGMNQGRTMDLKRDYMMDAKMSGINGHRVGVSVKLKGDLSLDLEYQTIDGEESARNNALILSLSSPLNL